jgi:hypothetical protein
LPPPRLVNAQQLRRTDDQLIARQKAMALVRCCAQHVAQTGSEPKRIVMPHACAWGNFIGRQKPDPKTSSAKR